MNMQTETGNEEGGLPIQISAWLDDHWYRNLVKKKRKSYRDLFSQEKKKNHLIRIRSIMIGKDLSETILMRSGVFSQRQEQFISLF